MKIFNTIAFILVFVFLCIIALVLYNLSSVKTATNNFSSNKTNVVINTKTDTEININAKTINEEKVDVELDYSSNNSNSYVDNNNVVTNEIVTINSTDNDNSKVTVNVNINNENTSQNININNAPLKEENVTFNDDDGIADNGNKITITFDNVELKCEPTYYKDIAIRNAKYNIEKEELSKIQELIDSYSKPSSFFVFNTNDNMLMTFNATQRMFGASIVKLPFTYFCVSEIEKGKYKLDDYVHYYEHFRHGGSGVLKNRKSGTDYTIRELLYYIIHYSDNTAYYMLFNHLNLDEFKNFMTENGFNTNVYNNMPWDTSSAYTIGKFFQKIYYNYTNEINLNNNKIADLDTSSNSNETSDNNSIWTIYVDELKNSLDSPLKNNLGTKYKIASKSGWASLSYHEGGIVFTDNPYVVVIFTRSNGEYEDQRYMSNLIHAIDEFMAQYNSKNYIDNNSNNNLQNTINTN